MTDDLTAKWELSRRKVLAGAAGLGLLGPTSAFAQAAGPWSQPPKSKVDKLNFVVWTYGDIYARISKQFEADLDTTRTRVLQMGGLVEAQILAAIQAFATGEAALVAQVIENDARVNGYEVAIDGACNHIVVKRQPAASDLRLIMAISKIVTDLNPPSMIGKYGS